MKVLIGHGAMKCWFVIEYFDLRNKIADFDWLCPSYNLKIPKIKDLYVTLDSFITFFLISMLVASSTFLTNTL